MIAIVSLILSSIWLAWTVLVDFFVVPTAFRTIPDFFLAGEIGIQVFSTLNQLEFPIASILLALSALQARHRLKWLVVVNVMLVGIAGVYLFSLTPKITALSAAWQYADQVGTLGVEGAADVQQLHQQYHRAYVVTDSVKLLLLSLHIGVLGWSLKKRLTHD